MLGVLPLLAPGEDVHAVSPAVPDPEYFFNECVREQPHVVEAQGAPLSLAYIQETLRKYGG